MFKRLAVLAAVAAFAAGPAFAEKARFAAMLRSEGDTAQTGSKATGVANITVDTETQRVDMTLDVAGLKIADLSDGLIARPVGPIHLHNYQADGEVVLVLPAPFGPGYTDTDKGFKVVMTDYDYAAGAAALKSTLSFDDFMKVMRSGTVVLNIHTDKFGSGEISGKVLKVVPAVKARLRQ
jgi:hypothetical protein